MQACPLRAAGVSRLLYRSRYWGGGELSGEHRKRAAGNMGMTDVWLEEGGLEETGAFPQVDLKRNPSG